MHQNKGMIERAQGRLDEALQSFQSFLQLTEELVHKQKSSDDSMRDLSFAHNRLGLIFEERNELEKAKTHYLEEQRIVRELLRNKPESTQLLLQLATTHEHLGDVGQDRAESYSLSIQLLDRLLEMAPESIDVVRALASAHEKQGVLLRNAGKAEEALRQFEIQWKLLQGLPEQLSASDVRIRRSRALCMQNKGVALLAGGQRREAREILQASVKESEAIAMADPSNKLHQADLASALGALAACHWELAAEQFSAGSRQSIPAALQLLHEGRTLLARALAGEDSDAANHQDLLRKFDDAIKRAGEIKLK
jgi:tetratricopeptide (TPR) repeat protein